MTPRTRTSNKQANFKVYYSKKVPQQVYFPHKKKTVRRPEAAEQNGADKKQMKFLPEKMRKRTSDVEEETEEETAEEAPTVQVAAHEETPSASPVDRRWSKKRKNDNEQEEYETEEEHVSTSNKRRRRTIASKTRRPSEAIIPKLVKEPSRTLRRQSTMTQLADGRQPSSGAEELDFKPIKRSRASWAGAGTDKQRDKKQRTLTQMIPGMGRLTKEELDELSDLDADLEDNQTNDDRVSQSLMERGLLEINGDSTEFASVQLSGNADNQPASFQQEIEHEWPNATHEQPSVIVQSVEDPAGDDDEEDYQPTQFIEAPVRRSRQTARRTAVRQHAIQPAEPAKSAKSRFSLLSTPEKRRVFEIPSSQSPAESVLSTQTSTQKFNRSALRDSHGNVAVIAETPSKRRQITFQEPDIQPAPPARLRKFESTIQDSEDEEASDLEDALAEQEYAGGTDHTVHSRAVGADTQAVINEIDQACADAEDEPASDNQRSSGEPDEPAIRQGAYKPSPELGESWAPVIYDDDGPEYMSYRSTRLGGESQSLRGLPLTSKESLPLTHQSNEAPPVDANDSNASLPTDNIPSTPPVIQLQSDDDLPSTPMVIRDESSDDEEAEAEHAPPRTTQRIVPQTSSIMIQQTADLDGEPVQVPCSPSAERETQQSHSSKAEQQLQSEWLSYSQYVHARAPNSSSMHAAADAFSYHATPRLLGANAATASSARIQHSQATTVDEVTPKNNRTQRVVSANTTPHRISKSQPFASPDKPPSLFIPSSFPSPSRVAMEGWSSPVIGRTQNLYGTSQALGSLEDFSIPLPPPIEDD